MEFVAYRPVGEEKRLKFDAKTVMPLAMISTKGFPEPTVQCILAVNRKYLAYTKSPKTVKVVQRFTAKHTDIDLPAEVLALVYFPSSDRLLVLGSSGDVFVISVTESADQAIKATTYSYHAEVEMRRAAALNSQDAILLSTEGGVFSMETTAEGVITVKALSIPPTDSPRYISATANHSLLALPEEVHKDGVRLLDTKTLQCALPKEWTPHGDEPVARVLLFDSTTHKTGGVRVVTATENCRELRLWTFVRGSSPVLHQTITIEEDAPRKLVVDPSEGYLALLSVSNGGVVLMELTTETEVFAVRRITEWDAEAPLLDGVLVTRKISAPSAKLTVELGFIARTTTGVKMASFDSQRLDGEANVGEQAGREADQASSSVTKWFSNREGSTGPMDPNGPAISISSSSRGGTNQAAAAKESERIREEAATQITRLTEQVRRLLMEVKTEVENLQPLASTSLTTLQAPQQLERMQRAVADSVEKFGPHVSADSTPAASADASNDRVRRYFGAVTDQTRKLLFNVASKAFEASLKKQAAIVAPNLTSGSSIQGKDIPMPKLSSTESVSQFQARIERAHKAQNDAIKSEIAKIRGQCADTISAVKKRSTAATTTSKVHLQSVTNAFALLKADIAALAEIAPKNAGAAAPNPKDPTAILEKSKTLAKTGSWEEAFANVLEAANLNILCQFLEADDVVANRHIITGATALSFPVVHALCQQLTYNIQALPGLIALRIGWIHDILVGWDENFTALRDGKAKDSDMFQRCSYDFVQMSNALEALSPKDVDTATRRQLTLVRRLLRNLG